MDDGYLKWFFEKKDLNWLFFVSSFSVPQSSFTKGIQFITWLIITLNVFFLRVRHENLHRESYETV